MDWPECADVAEDQRAFWEVQAESAVAHVGLVPTPQIQKVRTVSPGFPALAYLPLGLIPSNQHSGRSMKRLIENE